MGSRRSEVEPELGRHVVDSLPMRRWVYLATALLWAGSSGALEVECPGSTWYGNALQDCPCCEVCPDGSFVVEGERECPIGFAPSTPTARRPVARTVYDAARGRQPTSAPAPRTVQPIAAIGQSDAADEIAAFCQRKWVTDYSMQEYCQREQAEALLALEPYANFPDGDERRNILGRCLIKWEKGGLSDWTMVKYCTDEQVGAYEALR